MVVPDLVEGGNVHFSCIRFAHLPGHVIGKLVSHGAQALDHIHKYADSILANIVQIPVQKVSKSFSDSQDADVYGSRSGFEKEEEQMESL